MEAVKHLKAAAEAVQQWDNEHGYGADDDGYNRLATLYDAANKLGPDKVDVPQAQDAKLREFVGLIARMFIAGEHRDLGDGPEPYNPEDGDGYEGEAEALYNLIRKARELTGEAPDTLVREEA